MEKIKTENSTGATVISIYEAHEELKELIKEKSALQASNKTEFSETLATEISGFITTLFHEIAQLENEEVWYYNKVPVLVSRLGNWFDLPKEILQRAILPGSGRSYNFFAREIMQSMLKRNDRLQDNERDRIEAQETGKEYIYRPLPELERNINQYQMTTDDITHVFTANLEFDGPPSDSFERERLQYHTLGNGCVKSLVQSMLETKGISYGIESLEARDNKFRNVLTLTTPIKYMLDGDYEVFKGKAASLVSVSAEADSVTKLFSEVINAVRAITSTTSEYEYLWSEKGIVTGRVGLICPGLDMLKYAYYDYDVCNDLITIGKTYCQSTKGKELSELLKSDVYEEMGLISNCYEWSGGCHYGCHLQITVDLKKAKKLDGVSHTLSSK